MSKKKHGMSGTRLYRIWKNMKDRCNKPKHHNYERYGGRGIRVCEEWQNDFMAFYTWAMANGYQEDLTIDRKDNDGNYEPSNCRWATQREQLNNRGDFNVLVTYKGKTQTLMEWSEETGLPFATLRYRIVESHWPVEDAFTIGIGEVKRNPHGRPPVKTKEEKARCNERRKELYRKQGKLPREEYLKKKKAEKEKNIEKIKKELEKSPGLSTRKMASKTGLSRSYVQRIYHQIREKETP